MGSGGARVLLLAAASLVVAVACNALTGSSDLELCRGAECETLDGGLTNVTPDARVVNPGGEDAGGDASSSTDSGVEAAADGGLGCQGALACERVVFASSRGLTGNLGGLPGADLKCQQLADSDLAHPRVKGRTFMAWVSTSATSVSARFPHGTRAYRTPSGALIANDWTDLTDGSIQAGLKENEVGGNAGGQSWTGTVAVGASTSARGTCLDWTSSDNVVRAERGNLGATGGGWTEYGDDQCDKSHALYCFEY